MSQSPIVIVVAPQGAGKSTHGPALADRFGCTQIVDEWNGRDPLQPGDLALTNVALGELVA